MITYTFDGPSHSHSVGVAIGQVVTFYTDGDAVLERSADVINWETVATESGTVTHKGPKMAYRVRGSHGMATIEVDK